MLLCRRPGSQKKYSQYHCPINQCSYIVFNSMLNAFGHWDHITWMMFLYTMDTMKAFFSGIFQNAGWEIHRLNFRWNFILIQFSRTILVIFFMKLCIQMGWMLLKPFCWWISPQLVQFDGICYVNSVQCGEVNMWRKSYSNATIIIQCIHLRNSLHISKKSSFELKKFHVFTQWKNKTNNLLDFEDAPLIGTYRSIHKYVVLKSLAQCNMTKVWYNRLTQKHLFFASIITW